MSAPVAPPVCYDCGTIQSIRQVVVQGQASGAGAVAGGVLGGVLGHQIGHGRGNDAATVLGAVGGAVAGHEIEKSRSKSVRYEIAVQMDDGRMQVIRWRDQPGWREGDRVRVIDGGLAPIGQQY
jgi:outer membrane lipoprotein SlyB